MSNNMYYSFTQPSLLYVWETQSSRDVGKFLSLVKSADKIYTSVVFPLWISSYLRHLRPYCPRGLQHSQFIRYFLKLEATTPWRMVRVPLDLRAKSFITMGMHTIYMGKFMVSMVWSILLIHKKFIINYNMYLQYLVCYLFILLLQMTMVN